MTAGFTVVAGVPPGRGREAARLCPPGAVCAVVDWPLPPDEADAAILPEAAAALGGALAACGRVAFRCDAPVAGADAYVPPPRRSMQEMVLHLAGRGGEVSAVSVASSPAAAAALFAYGGWSWGWQAAIAFGPGGDPAPIVAALGRDTDWRRSGLPHGARLLFGPGHDGAFAVVAAADAAWLDRFRAALTR